MGLDMYLEARKYVSGYDFRPVTEQNTYEDLLSLTGVSKSILPESATPSATVSIGAMYWRKVNAVHNWLVENVQSGVDDCKSYWASRDTLKELQDLCRKVTDNHALAEELLPTGAGFFFGDTEYTEWYFQDIETTEKELGKLLDKFTDEWEFYYTASW